MYGRTLDIVFPRALEVDFCAEAPAHDAQAAAPGNGVGDGVVLVEVVLGEAWIHALVRVGRVLHLLEQPAGAYAWGDALGDGPLLGLYAQHLGLAHDADRLIVAAALGEVHHDAEAGGEAAARVGDVGGVVGHEGAQLAGGRPGLAVHV